MNITEISLCGPHRSEPAPLIDRHRIATSTSDMENELRHLSRTIVRIINERDFDYKGAEAKSLVAEHVANDWYGRFDDLPWTITFAEQTEAWRQVTIDYPDVYFDLDDIECEVRRKDRTAEVLLKGAMTGQKGLQLQGLCELKWKFSSGKWMWYYHHAIRGLREI